MKIAQKLIQTAVYWSSPSASGYGGYTYSTPSEIDCRWEKKQILYIDINGQEKLSNAIVYVNQDLDVNGYLYLGEEADLDSSHDNPQIIDNVFRIEAFKKVPNIQGSQYLRKAYL